MVFLFWLDQSKNEVSRLRLEKPNWKYRFLELLYILKSIPIFTKRGSQLLINRIIHSISSNDIRSI